MYDPILVTLLKMRPHSSQSSRENATPSSGIFPLASYREVPPPPGENRWRLQVTEHVPEKGGHITFPILVYWLAK